VATKRQKVEVGIFLMSAGTLLAIALLVLAGVRHKELDSYYIEFEESAAGLTEGSKVTYRGVPVGKIVDLRVTADNRVGVTLGVDPAKVTLRQGVFAQLNMETLFSPVVVNLVGGEDKSKPAIEPGSTIPVKPSLIADLEKGVPGAVDRVNSLLEGLNRLLGQVKPDDLPTLLHDVDTLIQRTDRAVAKLQPDDIPRLVKRLDDLVESANRSVADVHAQADKIAQSVDAAVRSAQAEIEKISTKANSAIDRLHATIEKTADLVKAAEAAIQENRPAIASSIKHAEAILAKARDLDLAATDKSVRQAAGQIGKAAEDVGVAAKGLAVSRQDLRRSVDSVERAIQRSLDELNETLRSVRDLVDYLQRDPAALLRGKGQAP